MQTKIDIKKIRFSIQLTNQFFLQDSFVAPSSADQWTGLKIEQQQQSTPTVTKNDVTINGTDIYMKKKDDDPTLHISCMSARRRQRKSRDFSIFVIVFLRLSEQVEREREKSARETSSDWKVKQLKIPTVICTSCARTDIAFYAGNEREFLDSSRCALCLATPLSFTHDMMRCTFFCAFPRFLFFQILICHEEPKRTAGVKEKIINKMKILIKASKQWRIFLIKTFAPQLNFNFHPQLHAKKKWSWKWRKFLAFFNNEMSTHISSDRGVGVLQFVCIPSALSLTQPEAHLSSSSLHANSTEWLYWFNAREKDSLGARWIEISHRKSCWRWQQWRK